MNGKTAKKLRAAIGYAGTTEYEVTPGQPFTIRMKPACGRKRYQEMKRRYKAARSGELFGTLAWPAGL